MELKHLTDEEIQDYLDSSPSSVDRTIEEHLKTCQLCKGALEEYKRVYAELKVDKGFELPPNFANLVLSRLPQKAPSRPHTNYAGIILVILGLISGISLMFYFVGWKYISQGITDILQPQLDFVSNYWGTMGRLLADLNIDFGLLFLSGLILFIISLLDHIIFHKKHKPVSFFC
jgi:hypothetical protein